MERTMVAWNRARTRQRSGNAFPCTAVAGQILCFTALLGMAMVGLVVPGLLRAQSSETSIRFDKETHVFRIDAAHMSYALGINEITQVHTLYLRQPRNTEDIFEAT